MHYNDFDEVVEQKYKPLNQVRFEYPILYRLSRTRIFPRTLSTVSPWLSMNWVSAR